MENRIGQQIGNYRLIRSLGQGGFGGVYLGEHIHLGTWAAIKILHGYSVESEVECFLTEARTIAQLVHPHIVRILDFGVEGKRPFLVMEYAPNGTLRQKLQKGVPLPVENILSYVKQVATALQYAHDQRLIHRDVKPENMLLGSNNEVLLTDFGIAIEAHTEISISTQGVVGTPHYMAPEQFQGKPMRASDQYSLGIVVYEWLCGERPFEGTSFIEIAICHLHGLLSPLRKKVPAIPPAIEAIVMKALAKDPAGRFASVQDFAHALEQASKVEQSSIIGTRFVPTAQDWNTLGDFSVAEGKTFFPEFQEKMPLTPTVQNLDEQASVEDARSFMGTDIHSPSPASLDSPLSAQLRQFSLRRLPQSPSPRPSFRLGIAQLLEEGENHYKAKRYEEALVVYDRIIQLDPLEVRAQGNKGNVLGRLGRYEEALVAYNGVLAIDPKHASIWNAKGDVLSKLKLYEEAVVAYTSALALNPKNALTWATKGDMLSKLRRYEDALVAYNQCLDIDSKNVLVWISKGNLLSKLRRYEDALVCYNSALGLNPKNALIWTIKGKMLSKLERYEDALVAYTCASDITPKKALIWVAKGEVLSQLKRYEEALIAYERAHILNPSDVAIAHKCAVLRDLKHHREELAQVQVAGQLKTKVFHQDPSVHLNSDQQFSPSFSKGRETSDLSKQAAIPPRYQGINEPSRQEQEGTRILERFDVFVSYSHTDAQWVENLANRLVDEHHFRVWLDKWLLIPGQPWQPALTRALDQANSCAICIGKQTEVGWFKQEIQKALARQAKDPNFRVFAVLLPNAEDLVVDEFLQLNTWVDFRNVDSAYAFHILACGVRGEPPGRWPLNSINSMNTMGSIKTVVIVEDMLLNLNRLKETGLITEPIKEEYMRLTMEKVWFTQWTSQIKDDTNE